jgi:hypothetical protein
MRFLPLEDDRLEEGGRQDCVSCGCFLIYLFNYLIHVCTDFLQGFTLNGKPVLNNFLKVKGTFETSASATVHTPLTILLHFYLRSIKHMSHFNVVEQLLSEFYIEAHSNLQIQNIPFNVTDAEALEEWVIEAESRAAQLSAARHVIVFIMTHTDPDRGDPWLGHNPGSGESGAAAVDDASTCLFLFYCTDVDRELNSGFIKYSTLSVLS